METWINTNSPFIRDNVIFKSDLIFPCKNIYQPTFKFFFVKKMNLKLLQQRF